MKEYTLNLDNLDKLQAELGKLNKRATRLGVPPITLTVLRDATINRKYAGRKVTEAGKVVTVDGPSPIVAGFTFVAALEHLSTGNLVKNIGTEELPRKYRTAGPACDHCKKIRSRKDTYVVRKDGKFLQVGKSCLKDFTGHKDPETLASWLDALSTLDRLASDCGGEGEMDEGFGGSGRRILCMSTKELVELAMAWVHANGYRSTKACAFGETSTKEYLQTWAFPVGDKDKEFVKEVQGGYHKTLKPVKVTAKIKRDAKACLAWIKKEGSKARCSEYMSNLHAATALDQTPIDRMGLVASCVPSWMKAVGEEVKRQKEKEGIPVPDEPYLGKIGERREFTAKVMTRRDLDGEWGLTSFIKMLTPEGHWLFWKASDPGVAFDQGNTVKFKGTVSEHKVDTYNADRPTTFVKRCKLVEMIEEVR